MPKKIRPVVDPTNKVDPELFFQLEDALQKSAKAFFKMHTTGICEPHQLAMTSIAALSLSWNLIYFSCDESKSASLGVMSHNLNNLVKEYK